MLASSAAVSFADLSFDHLPLSARVDFLHLLALGKPAVRTRLSGRIGVKKLRHWCQRNAWAWAADSDGFCSVAKSRAIAQRVLEVDRCIEPHELELGRILGYPRCCCRAIAKVGEARIDQQIERLGASDFEGEYALIDPRGYSRGVSLICHVPCGPKCLPSLRIARGAASYIRQHAHHPVFATWTIPVLKDGR